MQTTHIREEIKFLYKKKDKLNENLYKTHIQAALVWGKTWDLIHNSIHNMVNRELERKYRLLENKITRLKETQVEKIYNTYKFFPRVINQTDIKFTTGELTLLNKGLKYNLGYKHTNWIRDLGPEGECAITLLPPRRARLRKIPSGKTIEDSKPNNPQNADTVRENSTKK